MKIPFYLLFTLLFYANTAQAQRGFDSNGSLNCGTDLLMKELLQKNAVINNINKQVESALLQYKRNASRPLTPSAVTILPVVVHIIHNNGVENISDTRVLAGIQHLNEAYANTGYYDNGSGVNTNIQFCLAQRAPDGSNTNGITRDISSYTNMGGPDYFSDDLSVKNINRWDPKCYINIWLVNDIPGAVAGYAYLPSAHGMSIDGIVMEAAYFGASYADDIVTIHEMGHYLGLYHTFEQGCNNNNCTSDGDKVCDTPPDNSTSVTSCDITVNSCSSDIVSGFATDQNDLTEDYMDYGNWDCMSVFTQGQSERINWHILNVRSSLLHCYSCLPPCPAPVTAAFTASAHIADAGTNISFNNTSLNGSSYTWYVNGSVASNTFNYNQLFTQGGKYIIRLKVESSNPGLCMPMETTDSIMINCPVQASFTPGYNGVSTVGQNITFTNTSNNASSIEWYYDNNPVGTLGTYNASFGSVGNHSIKLKASNNYCTDSFTIYYRVNAPADSHFSFKKKYSATELGFDYFGSSFNLITPDQHIISIASKESLNNLITKYTSTGDIVWSKTYKSNNTTIKFTKAILTNDGNIVFLGWPSTGITGPLIMKTDLNGNIIWNRFFSEPASVIPTDIIEMPDGSFIISGNYYYGYLIFYKITASGQLSWRKTLAYGDFVYSYHNFQNIGNEIYFACTIANQFGPSNVDGLLLKVDPSNANIIFAKRYDIGNLVNWFTRMIPVGNKLLIEGIAGPSTSFSYLKKKMLLLADLSGEAENCKLIYYPELTMWRGEKSIFKSANNDILFSLADSIGLKSHLVRFDSSLQLIKGRTYLLQTEYSSHHSINEFSNGDILIGQGDMFNNNILDRLLPDLTNAPCESIEFTPGIEASTITATDITSQLVYANNFAQTDSTLAISIQNRNVISTVECSSISTMPCDTTVCNIYKLLGPTKICQLTDTLNIIVNKSSNCRLATDWTVSGTATYQVVSQTDSLIKIKTSSIGSVLVKASSTSSCKIIEDSLEVDIINSPSSINLGADIQLCNASTVNLNAGSGFKSYRWQNGSVDSTFTTYLPGTYFVTTTDFCGNQYSDSINITTAPSTAFELGPDKEICANDTITMVAPAGFSDYNWSPNYAISDQHSSTVKLYPLVDTVYTITAVKGLGCLVLDSIRIQVHQFDSVKLGNDTSFCQGNFISLNAAGDFVTYQWNTGSVSQMITASSAGQYTVSATDRNGCIAKDSINILAVFPNPAISLGNDRNLCENDSIILNAGNGFTDYQWQDLSTQQVFTVRNTGLYWVTVKDDHHCTGSDSIQVLNIVPNPIIHLGTDTSFCEGQFISLSPGTGFSSYTWQDNSHGQIFTAWHQGQYWVKVNDTNNCAAADTLLVLALYPKPILNLGKDTILCKGESISLDAGTGITQYLWQDNSNGQFFTADTTGYYWVRVLDSKGCFAIDSLQVLDIVTPPVNFVMPDYTICYNSKTYIKPIGQYNSYWWNDGTVSDSVLITSSGNYWLKVTDAYGCEATENFEVFIKDCINTIYFPNAFSPNSNSVNNIFKPKIFGTVEQYHLQIYNRFGEKVFESNDFAKGWNGMFKNAPQSAGAYVWYCNYKLPGQFTRIQKGSLVLIR